MLYLKLFLIVIRSLLQSSAALRLENLALRQQLAVHGGAILCCMVKNSSFPGRVDKNSGTKSVNFAGQSPRRARNTWAASTKGAACLMAFSQAASISFGTTLAGCPSATGDPFSNVMHQIAVADAAVRNKRFDWMSGGDML